MKKIHEKYFYNINLYFHETTDQTLKYMKYMKYMIQFKFFLHIINLLFPKNNLCYYSLGKIYIPYVLQTNLSIVYLLRTLFINELKPLAILKDIISDIYPLTIIIVCIKTFIKTN